MEEKVNLNVALMQGQIETGYKYWINLNYLCRIWPEIDSIDIGEYPYNNFYYGFFYDTKKKRDLAFNYLKSYLGK